ncbi:MAG: O-antigen ligase family protein [Solirubrobacteraceae bacterium]
MADAGAPVTARARSLPGLPGLRVVILALFGAACGLSTLAGGFYDVTVWGPIALGVFALTLALVVNGAGRAQLVPAIAAGALVFLWLWSWISASWGESADQAYTYAGLWALYAAAFLALILLMQRRNQRWVPLAFASAGVVAVGLYVVIQMASGEGADLFFGGRLRDPLGYVNGQAGYFLLGFWPCVAMAEQSGRKILAGAGAAGAVVLGSLLMLSQSRGVVPALIVSAAVVLAIVPGRARRVWVLVAVGVVLAAISSPLLDVYQDAAGATEPGAVAPAGRAILLAAVLLGVGWGLLQLLFERTTRTAGSSLQSKLVQAEGPLALVVAVLAIGGALAAVGNPADRISQQYDDFVNLRVDDSSDTRFLSGGGYRYDYWRVAWQEFKDEPLHGVGAGNYTVGYFTERRTSEDIRQPHSLPMQLLAELGIPGLLALLAFVGAVVVGLWRTAWRGSTSPGRRALAVAGGGAFAAWLMHTSVDWLHILPGVTGVALCAAAPLVAPWSRQPVDHAFSPGRIQALLIGGVALLAASALVGRIALADHYRTEGRGKLTSDPVEALRLANRALAFNSQSVPALYIKSAAYARVNRYAAARAALVRAGKLEPSNPLPPTLLGDLSVRRGDIAAAKSAYGLARRLDPRNALVEGLAKDPRSALPAKP